MHCRSISRFKEREARHEIGAPIHCSALQEIAFHFAFVWHCSSDRSILLGARSALDGLGCDSRRGVSHASQQSLSRRTRTGKSCGTSNTNRIDYDLRINGELATGHVNFAVDVLKNGWVSVPVPTGLPVREARLDSKLVSLAVSQVRVVIN